MHKQLFKQSHGRETSRVRRMQHAAEDEVMALLWDEDLEAVIRMAKRAQARSDLSGGFELQRLLALRAS